MAHLLPMISCDLLICDQGMVHDSSYCWSRQGNPLAKIQHMESNAASRRVSSSSRRQKLELKDVKHGSGAQDDFDVVCCMPAHGCSMATVGLAWQNDSRRKSHL